MFLNVVEKYSTAVEGNLAYLACDEGDFISNVTFASYGKPVIERCGDYGINGYCHSTSSYGIVSQACIGKSECKGTFPSRFFSFHENLLNDIDHHSHAPYCYCAQ